MFSYSKGVGSNGTDQTETIGVGGGVGLFG